LLALNSALDLDALTAAFAAERRLQVPDFLDAPSAVWTWDQLANATPWGLVFNEGGRVVELDNAQLRAMTPQQIGQIYAGVNERAKTGYQFLYHMFPLATEYFNTASQLPLLQVYEWLNSEATLDWLRALTGRPDIRWAHAQATLYAKGHFLKSHSDLEPGHNRRAVAFVLNMTQGWQRDWGGYLQFFNDRHDVELAWYPSFNTLNLFAVPHDHSVEMVTNFAGGKRLAITGWLRTDEPPGAFGRLGVAG
jgi:Rps23 Pro-64 3,4-dihydroxylase Tpa1-like proline 4-hydroxylase